MKYNPYIGKYKLDRSCLFYYEKVSNSIRSILYLKQLNKKDTSINFEFNSINEGQETIFNYIRECIHNEINDMIILDYIDLNIKFLSEDDLLVQEIIK